MKALITLLNSKFMPGFNVFFKSLIKHNPWFNLDFLIIDIGLTNQDKKHLLNAYPKIQFRDVDYLAYEKINFSKTAERLRCTYYTFEVFKQFNYDKLVCIDMDTVILGDISELFNNKFDFAGCKSYGRNNDSLNLSINSGVFVVSKKYLNEDVYRRLIKMAEMGHSMPDQRVLNDFFKLKMQYLNKKFNVEKRMITTQKYKNILSEMVILHFVGSKPWDEIKERGYEKFENLWKSYV